MTRFWFAMCRSENDAQTGIVEAPTLPDALHVVSQRAFPRPGDKLDIGMPGFPPARYECVSFELGPRSWRLVNRMAA